MRSPSHDFGSLLGVDLMLCTCAEIVGGKEREIVAEIVGEKKRYCDEILTTDPLFHLHFATHWNGETKRIRLPQIKVTFSTPRLLRSHFHLNLKGERLRCLLINNSWREFTQENLGDGWKIRENGKAFAALISFYSIAHLCCSKIYKIHKNFWVSNMSQDETS